MHVMALQNNLILPQRITNASFLSNQSWFSGAKYHTTVFKPFFDQNALWSNASKLNFLRQRRIFKFGLNMQNLRTPSVAKVELKQFHQRAPVLKQKTSTSSPKIVSNCIWIFKEFVKSPRYIFPLNCNLSRITSHHLFKNDRNGSAMLDIFRLQHFEVK